MDITPLHFHLHVNGERFPFHTVAVDMVFKCVYPVRNGLNMASHQLFRTRSQALGDSTKDCIFSVPVKQSSQPFGTEVEGSHLRDNIALPFIWNPHIVKDNVKHLPVQLSLVQNPYRRQTKPFLINLRGFA